MDPRPQPATREPISADPLKLLVDTGLMLARERSVDTIVQAALDAGGKLCNAQWGAFFYTVAAADGAPCPLCKVTGTAAEDPANFPLSKIDRRLIEILFGDGTVRCADISGDAHFGPGSPYAPLTSGPNPARSYFAVPVHSASGELLGGLLYGHPEPHVFEPGCQPLVETLAAQAAVAIDNALLQERLTRQATEVGATHKLQRDKAEADRRLRQALDAAQLGTWEWDRATDLIDLDERAGQLFDFDPKIPITRSALRDRILVEEDHGITTSNLQRAVETGTLYNAEYRIHTTDGSVCWLCANGMPTFAPDSTEVIGMIGTIQDISLRKTQESALRQSEKLAATGRLAATIAHEINNPLEAVTNLIYLVKTDPTVPPVAQHLLETADQELARVAQIAQQTLGFYRDTTRPVDINLQDLFETVFSLFQRKLTYKKIEFALDLEPGLHVHGLQGELRQVFSNLVVNAIDASLHGRITVRGRRRTVDGVPGVSILVCDQGSGIPPGIRQRLFSPFFTTKQSVGTGLGLWVTRGILEKQGGSIRFRSNSTGPTGTIFRVFLRAAPENLLPETPDPKLLQ
ncbi:MAG TPA: ATP-binding protein [Acidobacteriaceae bacterium]|nr:ATP-binding protein [Acidobacteriaceae bacterium]